MKTTKLIFTLLLFSFFLSAQPWEDKVYTHNGAFLSSGSVAANYSTSPGFLLAGYKKTSAANTPNFYVERTGIGGYYPASSSTYSFCSTYTILGQQTCSGLPAANNCIGVSVIEENVPGGTNYALAGGFSDGVFFSMLNPSGAPISTTTIFWPFPPNSTFPTKPLIVASTTPNEYFITGSYSVTGTGRLMYLLKVSGSGTFFASMNYNIAANMGMTPNGILMSPYGSANEVVIIGEAYDTGGNGSFTNKGFFALFDTTSLNNNSCNVYGQTPGSPSPDDRFQSITVSNNSGGYVIGGYTNIYPGGSGGNLWALDLNSAGNAFNWNTLLIPSANNGPRGLKGLIERYSSIYSTYSYYGVVEFNSSSTDMMVVKLDNTGNWWANSFNNEFHYPSPASVLPTGACISYLDNGGSDDQGIHVFGTDDAANGGKYFFVEATFNGDEGCTTNTLISTSTSSFGPSNINPVGVNNLSGLSTCGNFSLAQAGISPIVSYICGTSYTFPSGGSMNKQQEITGLVKNINANDKISIYPNPASEKIHIQLNYANNRSFQLFNCMGQLIKNFETTNSSGLEVDLNSLKIESGLYFIQTTIDDTKYTEKFIYTKN